MVRLTPMLGSEFEAYLEMTVPEYAAENIQTGYWSEEGALERSRQAYMDLLPQDIQTENNYLFRIQGAESREKICAHG